MRLRRDSADAEVVRIEAVYIGDRDLLRALFAAHGKLVIHWEEPPGIRFLLIMPDAPEWPRVAVQLTVRPERMVGLELVTVGGLARRLDVRVFCPWETRRFGGSGLFELE
jgi:hypothetical protein